MLEPAVNARGLRPRRGVTVKSGYNYYPDIRSLQVASLEGLSFCLWPPCPSDLGRVTSLSLAPHVMPAPSPSLRQRAIRVEGRWGGMARRWERRAAGARAAG